MSSHNSTAYCQSTSLLHTPSRNPALLREPSRCRSEEHTSELQSQSNLVCRLLLEKKKHSRCSAICPDDRQGRGSEHNLSFGSGQRSWSVCDRSPAVELSTGNECRSCSACQITLTA